MRTRLRGLGPLLVTTVAILLSMSSVVPFASADAAPPGPVVAPLIESVTATSIAVRWTPPADTSTVLGYLVDYSADQGHTWHPGAEVDDPAATTATVSGLATGQSYDLRVEAFGTGGNGPSRFVDPVQSIGMYGYDNCAALLSGRVRCWSWYDQPHDMPKMASSAQVTVGGSKVCALRTNGDVTCGPVLGTGEGMTIAGLPHDITQIAFTGTFGCALTAAGSVWCWGRNYNGELGIGVTSSRWTAPVQVTALGGAASFIAANAATACAVLRDGGQLVCWGAGGDGLLGDGGTADQSLPVPVAGMTGVQDVSIGLYAACAALERSGGGYEDYCWGTSPGGQLYTPEHVADGYSMVGAFNYNPPAPCMAGPSGSACYGLSSPDVMSITTDGWATACARYVDGSARCQAINQPDWYWATARQLEASAITTADPTVPNAPDDIQAAPASAGRATVSWLAPTDGGSPITGYRMQRSIDGGQTWTSFGSESTATERLVTEPAQGRADVYRVQAQNSVGVSAWSARVVVTPGGTGPQQVTVQLPSGSPVSGGALTWSASDGHGSSAGPSSLTADGVLTFPRVIPGWATVTIADGLLPNGSTVSGSWRVALGTDPQTLSVPAQPDIVTRSVKVTLPNDVPVVGASVRGTTGFLSDTCTISGAFTFCGGVARTVATDGDGIARISGWSTGDLPTADVAYSDGVLTQNQSVRLSKTQTTVQLEYMPWLTVDADGSPIDRGLLTRFAFAAKDAQHASTQGVSITVKAPAGWKARSCSRPSVMSGHTNRYGRLALHVCASASGVYRVVASGAVTTKAVFLRVRGAVPMSPTSPTLRSPRSGVATASWGRPVYSGGAAITAYRVTATSPKQRSQTALVTNAKYGGVWTAKAMTHRFTGLASGHKWTIKVIAITRFGTSRAVAGSLMVA